MFTTEGGAAVLAFAMYSGSAVGTSSVGLAQVVESGINAAMNDRRERERERESNFSSWGPPVVARVALVFWGKLRPVGIHREVMTAAAMWIMAAKL